MKQEKVIFRSKELAIVHELPNRYPYWQHWSRKEKPDVVWAVDGKRRTFRTYRKVRIVKDENSLLARMFGENDKYYDIYVRTKSTVDSGSDD